MYANGINLKEETVNNLKSLGINPIQINAMIHWAEDSFEGHVDNKFMLDQWAVLSDFNQAHKVVARFGDLWKLNDRQGKDLEAYLLGSWERPFESYDEQKRLDAMWIAMKYKMSEEAIKIFVEKKMVQKILESEQFK